MFLMNGKYHWKVIKVDLVLKVVVVLIYKKIYLLWNKKNYKIKLRIKKKINNNLVFQII